jgi:hypothetical protein
LKTDWELHDSINYPFFVVPVNATAKSYIEELSLFHLVKVMVDDGPVVERMFSVLIDLS